jgi:hypothetical protein
MKIPGLRFPGLLTCAIALGTALACQQAQPAPAQAAPAADAAAKELAAVKADIKTLKDKARPRQWRWPTYLRPQIPTTVPQTIVNMNPAATWPQ